MHSIFDYTFMTGSLFESKNYSGSFILPLNGDELDRDVFMGVKNKENNLDLQMSATCDNSIITGYLLTTDIASETQTTFTFDTNKYSCGDKVRIQ